MTSTNCIIYPNRKCGKRRKQQNHHIGFGTSDGKEEAKNKLKAELKTFFRPEFLNRLNDIILFNDFNLSILTEITKLELKKLSDKLEEKKIKLSTTTSLIKYIAEEAMKEKMGARPIKRLIQKNIENELK